MQLLENFKELSLHPQNATELKDLILQLAVQGKLTIKWREESPNVEDAAELLKRITAENERLIAEKKVKKGKVLPPIEEGEKPFDVPEKWIWCRFGNVINEIKGGGTPSKRIQAYWDGNLPWASVKDLKDFRYLTITKDKITEQGLVNSSAKLIPVDSLIICTRMGLGKVAINKIPLAINQDLKAVTLSSWMDIEFMYDYYKTLNVIGSGMTVSGIKQDELLRYMVALPPLKEQKAIVKVVNQLLTEVEQLEQLTKARITLKEDFATSALRRLTQAENITREWTFLQQHFPAFFTEKANIKKLRETILQLAVQGKLTAKWREENPDVEDAAELLKRIAAEKERLIAEKKIKKGKALPDIGEDEIPFEVPEGWIWSRLNQLTSPESIITYGILKPVWVEKGVPTVRIKDMKNGEIVLDEIAQCSQARANSFLKTKLLEGDLLIAKDGGTLGKTAMVPKILEGGNITQHVLRFSISKCFSSQFVRIIIDSPHGQRYMKGETKGAALPGVNVRDFRKMVVALPSVAEQKVIVQKSNNLMALCDQIEQQIDTSQTQIEQLMKSCLKEVFEKA